MPFLLFIALALSDNLQAQDAKVQSVEFKNFERLPDQPKDENLQLTKKEVKELERHFLELLSVRKMDAQVEVKNLNEWSLLGIKLR